MEEARAFANYLDWKTKLSDWKVFDAKIKKKIIQFAEQIPASEKTIQRRLSLLDLPNTVQTMLENESLYLGEAMEIVELKKLVHPR